MHACELGAEGVYRGHKCVARYFFRKNLAEIDSFRFHEKSHAKTFANLLSDRDHRKCYFSWLFFWGGLFYGVFVGLLGLRAIGTSTHTIEQIVDAEFGEALEKLKDEQAISRVIAEIQAEERGHREAGAALAADGHFLSGPVSKVARAGAYTAKFAAAHL